MNDDDNVVLGTRTSGGGGAPGTDGGRRNVAAHAELKDGDLEVSINGHGSSGVRFRLGWQILIQALTALFFVGGVTALMKADINDLKAQADQSLKQRDEIMYKLTELNTTVGYMTVELRYLRTQVDQLNARAVKTKE